jgi:hypothetical protein
MVVEVVLVQFMIGGGVGYGRLLQGLVVKRGWSGMERLMDCFMCNYLFLELSIP